MVSLATAIAKISPAPDFLKLSVVWCAIGWLVLIFAITNYEENPNALSFLLPLAQQKGKTWIVNGKRWTWEAEEPSSLCIEGFDTCLREPRLIPVGSAQATSIQNHFKITDEAMVSGDLVVFCFNGKGMSGPRMCSLTSRQVHSEIREAFSKPKTGRERETCLGVDC